MKSKILLTALFSSLPFIDNFASTSLSSTGPETPENNSNNPIEAPRDENLSVSEGSSSSTIKAFLDGLNSLQNHTNSIKEQGVGDDTEVIPLTQPDAEEHSIASDGSASQNAQKSTEQEVEFSPHPPKKEGIEASSYYNKETNLLDFSENHLYRVRLSDLEKERVKAFCYRIQNGREIDDFMDALYSLFSHYRDTLDVKLTYGWIFKNLDRIHLLAETLGKESEFSSQNKFSVTFSLIAGCFRYIEILSFYEYDVNDFFKTITESAKILLDIIKDKGITKYYDNLVSDYIITFCDIFLLYKHYQRTYNDWLSIDIRSYINGYRETFEKITQKIPVENMRYIGYLAQIANLSGYQSNNLLKLLKGDSLDDLLENTVILSKAIDKTIKKTQNPTDEELEKEFYNAFYDRSYFYILQQVCYDKSLTGLEGAIAIADKCFAYYNEKKEQYPRNTFFVSTLDFESFCDKIREQAKHSFFPDQILNSTEKLLELYFEWCDNFCKVQKFNQLHIFHPKDNYTRTRQSQQKFIESMTIAPLEYASDILYEVFTKDAESWNMFKKILDGYSVEYDSEIIYQSSDFTSIAEDFIRLFSDEEVTVHDIPLTIISAIILPYIGAGFKITPKILESTSNDLRVYSAKGPLFSALRCILAIMGITEPEPIETTETTENIDILNNITAVIKAVTTENNTNDLKLLEELTPYIEKILNYRGKSSPF